MMSGVDSLRLVVRLRSLRMSSACSAGWAITMTLHASCVVVCPAIDPPAVLGFVDSPDLFEISGAAVGATGIWVHNDGERGDRVHEIDRSGLVRRVVDLSNVDAVDVEDVALDPGSDRGSALVVGDIGDNAGSRDAIALYRFTEASAVDGESVVVQRMDLRYGDGQSRDAEALMVDPRDGTHFIWTKTDDGKPEIFDAPRGGVQHTLEAIDVDWRVEPRDWEPITAADISTDRRWIAARSRTRAWFWPLFGSQSVEAALAGNACEVELTSESQGEALAFSPSGFITLSEGDSSPIFEYGWP
jgi:hypothetical protein